MRAIAISGASVNDSHQWRSYPRRQQLLVRFAASTSSSFKRIPVSTNNLACALSRLSLHRMISCNSTFLAPFPRRGFLAHTSRGLRRFGTMVPLTPMTVAPATGLSAYSALPSKHPVLNHVMRPNVALSVALARSAFWASP